MAVEKQCRDWSKMALTCAQLGLLAEKKENPGQALEWAVRSVALFDDVPHPGSGTGPGQLARLGSQLGTEALEACWRRVTGGSLPDTVSDYVRSYRA